METRTAIVTGAARRIGAAIARCLHGAGFNVAVHYRASRTEAEELCRALNSDRAGSAETVQAELCEESSYPLLVEAAVRRFGRLDALVNNASAFFPTPLGDTGTDHWDGIMGANLRAPFFLSQCAAPELRKSRGCIVNITDIHALRPLRGYSVYSIAKAGLDMLTRALAKEFAPEIRVNAVAPGAIAWPEDMDSELKQRIISHTMLKRPGKPEDIAGAVRYLVCDAPYVTGQVLTVDGGRTLYS